MTRILRAGVALTSALLAIVLLWPHPLRAQSCTDGGCHKDVLDLPHVHSALSDGACTDCHQGEESDTARCKSGMTFTLEEDPALCLECHDDPKEKGRLHPALEDGCLTCHGAHGGQGAFNLTEASPSELCAQCHDPFEGKSVHPPVEDGECLECHDPHASKNVPLLRKPRSELCLECHDQDELRPKTKSGYVARHYPFESGRCLGCHRPHASKNDTLLRDEGGGLCLSCHGPAVRSPERSLKSIHTDKAYLHSPVEDGECLECHGPHGAPFPKLLKEARPDLCYECHDAFSGPFLHSAVRLGRCNVCHDAHGEQRQKMLTAADAGLCFRCHSDDLTGRKVQHAPAQAGACLSCHDPHQANNPKLLRRGAGKATCLSCHGEKGESSLKFKAEGKEHPAIARFGCTACHDPHGASNPRLLQGSIREVCSGCHPDQADGTHVFTSFAGKPHPVEGPRDPARPGQPFSCISCHDPHGSRSPKLWRQGKTRDDLCKRCHEKGQVVYRDLPAPAPSKKGGHIAAGARKGPAGAAPSASARVPAGAQERAPAGRSPGPDRG